MGTATALKMSSVGGQRHVYMYVLKGGAMGGARDLAPPTEMSLLLGTQQLSPPHRRLGQIIRQYWSNFIRTG